MTKDIALHKWFCDFAESNNWITDGIARAYVVTSVPEDAVLPYITYEYIVGDFENDVTIAVNIWTRTTSEVIPNTYAEMFRQHINNNPLIICDEGAIWAKTGSPFCQSLNDQVDRNIKRRYINLELSFETRY